MSAIHSWPKGDRPREKLLKNGAHALSNSELLAILLRSGTRDQSAVDLARAILSKFKTFRNMMQADARDWRGFKGMGDAKIAQIKAALEIGRRFREDEVFNKGAKINSSKDMADILMPQMRDLKVEVFKVAFLDSANQLIAIEDAATGTVNQARPIVREIVHGALQKYAAGIICAHNHPSGTLIPSREDLDFTQGLSQACKLMNLKLLDHIIVGLDGHYSFADQGELM
jgi:DNA repair protein RadC